MFYIQWKEIKTTEFQNAALFAHEKPIFVEAHKVLFLALIYFNSIIQT